jgi:hypothetical protein
MEELQQFEVRCVVPPQNPRSLDAAFVGEPQDDDVERAILPRVDLARHAEDPHPRYDVLRRTEPDTGRADRSRRRCARCVVDCVRHLRPARSGGSAAQYPSPTSCRPIRPGLYTGDARRGRRPPRSDSKCSPIAEPGSVRHGPPVPVRWPRTAAAHVRREQRPRRLSRRERRSRDPRTPPRASRPPSMPSFGLGGRTSALQGAR